MNEKDFLAFLKELGIPQNKSFGDIKDLLVIKMTEFQDSPMYMEDGGEEKQKQFDDAIDYAEKMKRMTEAGIKLASADEDGFKKEETKDESGSAKAEAVERLKNRDANQLDASDNVSHIEASGGQVSGQTNSQTPPVTQTQGSSPASKVAGNKWFVSITGAQNINDLFDQAIDALIYDEPDKARRILGTITQTELKNPGAYLALGLLDYNLKKISDIEYLTDDVVSFDELKRNTNLRRAHDYGNSAQSAEVDHYLEANKNFRIYKDAEKDYQKGNYADAEKQFASIAGYRDAATRQQDASQKLSEEVERHARKLRKEAPKRAMRKAGGFLSALAVFLVLIILGPAFGNFIDADDEGWFYEIDHAIHRFVPNNILEKEAYGRVYFGWGDLWVEAEKPGLPIFAPFADDIFASISHDESVEELEIRNAPYASATRFSVSNCKNLKKLSVEKSGVRFNVGISDCNNLSDLDIAGGTSDLNISNLDGLGKLTIPSVQSGEKDTDLITIWYENVYIRNCDKLEELTFRGCLWSNLEIENNKALRCVSLPGNIQGDTRIEDCELLETIELTGNCSGKFVVGNCPNLKEIKIRNDTDLEIIDDYNMKDYVVTRVD